MDEVKIMLFSQSLVSIYLGAVMTPAAAANTVY